MANEDAIATKRPEAGNARSPADQVQWLVGIDGGGSGCRARIESFDGRLVGTGAASPAAVRLGVDRSLAAVKEAACAAAADAGLAPEAIAQMRAVVGLAGVGRRGILEILLSRPHPFRTVKYLNDATIACIGAHRGRDGGVVISGTGSVGLAIVNGHELRIGGYGFPISDEASGADLGLKSIQAALRAHDGLTPSSELTREIMGRFGGDPLEVVSWMDWATATDYARFAPIVMELAERGDPLAAQIVEAAARELETLLQRLLEYGAPRIALLGGLGRRLEPWLSPEARMLLVRPQGDAVDGALFIARTCVMALQEHERAT